jgi:hypothetical protein
MIAFSSRTVPLNVENTPPQALYILCNKYSKLLDENIRKANFGNKTLVVWEGKIH